MADFRWFGHNCFRIRLKEAAVLTDPVGRNTGYAMAKQPADIVTISHDHPGHNNTSAVKGDYQLISGPGEYEISGVFVTGIRTYHDALSSNDRGYNTVYLIEAEGMVICHLGDLGHPLDSTHAEEMAQADILLVPAGGGPIISQEQAVEVVSLLEPKVVIPMQYQTDAGDAGRSPVDEFVSALGAEIPDPVDKFTLKSSELTDSMRLVLLTPSSESMKR